MIMTPTLARISSNAVFQHPRPTEIPPSHNAQDQRRPGTPSAGCCMRALRTEARHRSPRDPATGTVGFHGSPCGSWFPIRAECDNGGREASPEGVHSDADHRSVRRSPSSHAANLPSRDRAPRFQSRPRLRRLIVTTTITGAGAGDSPYRAPSPPASGASFCSPFLDTSRFGLLDGTIELLIGTILSEDGAT